MLDAAVAAAGQIFTPPFRGVLWKTLGLTLALLALVWIGLEKLILAGLALPSMATYPWVAAVLSFVGGVGLFIGLVFLVTPVSFLVAGFFFDELAEHVEAGLDPKDIGRAMPIGLATRVALEFAAVALAVNLVALLLLFAPGVNLVAFFGANAYLLGRGYFELAALRYLPPPEVARLRRANALQLFGAGLVMAAMLAVPVLNLLTPLFGAAFMARIAAAIRRTGPVAPPAEA
ncbi:sulfate transporter family protein [Methylocella silvestris]|uniref:sulfate transporter family protein n=1 Tax=Methylocella silvestris TaxID=199596 RepID=UPI001FDFEAFD|nr:sulfate transporter family protein [Methylocella silvestris]